jgi:hypothetical protein
MYFPLIQQCTAVTLCHLPFCSEAIIVILPSIQMSRSTYERAPILGTLHRCHAPCRILYRLPFSLQQPPSWRQPLSPRVKAKTYNIVVLQPKCEQRDHHSWMKARSSRTGTFYVTGSPSWYLRCYICTSV